MSLAQRIMRIRQRLWGDAQVGELARDADDALKVVQERLNRLEWRAGHVEVDFGAFPGADSADVLVDGQRGIEADAVVHCWIAPIDTADHSADEHVIEEIDVRCSAVRAGAGFTLTAFSTGASMLHGKWRVGWNYAGGNA